MEQGKFYTTSTGKIAYECNDRGDLEGYLKEMRSMKYKVISITPLTWEENQ